MLLLLYHLWALFQYPSILKKISSFVSLIELVIMMLADMNHDRWAVWCAHQDIFEA